MNEIVTLRGVILSRYKTIGAFAKAIGWKRTKASRIINGVQDPDMTDIQEITKLLEIKTQETFIDIFFAPLSTMWNNNVAE